MSSAVVVIGSLNVKDKHNTFTCQDTDVILNDNICIHDINFFFLKFKVFNVPSVAWNCSTVPQQVVIDINLNLPTWNTKLCAVTF